MHRKPRIDNIIAEPNVQEAILCDYRAATIKPSSILDTNQFLTTLKSSYNRLVELVEIDGPEFLY